MMKSKVLLMVCLALLSSIGYGQTADIWKSISKIEDNKYIVNIPEGYKRVTLADGSGLDFKFDVTGVGIPATLNGGPMYGFYTISRLKGKQETQAMDQAILEFSSFYDRVTEPGYNYDTSHASIKGGQTGKLLHSRYYRRSKVSNYSRYYLIFYEAKTDETFVLALNFQYKDPSYDIERSAALTQYAKELFAHFEMR